MPVTADRFVQTGADRGADGIILDLEDAVAPSEKARTRTLIADAIPHVSRNGGDVLVRRVISHQDAQKIGELCELILLDTKKLLAGVRV